MLLHQISDLAIPAGDADTPTRHHPLPRDLSSTHEDPAPSGFALRGDDYEAQVYSNDIYRRNGEAKDIFSMSKACNYLALRPGPRSLLSTLILHLNRANDSQYDDPQTRFIVFPGNTYLSIALHTCERSIQRWAAKLEADGLVRRCYSRLNTRIGYDLSGFVSRVDEIISGFEQAVQDHRRKRRDERQCELVLGEEAGARGIVRPQRASAPATAQITPPTKLSPRGDSSVIHNRENRSTFESTASSAILDMLDFPSFAKASGFTADEEDRTGGIEARAVLAITRLMTGQSGRLARPWSESVAMIGQERSALLWMTALLDPMRRGEPAQYFAWLVKALSRPHMAPSVTAAIGRAQSRVERSSKAAAVKNPPSPEVRAASVTPDPDRESAVVGALPAGGDEQSRQGDAELIAALADSLTDATRPFLGNCTVRHASGSVTLVLTTGFRADYLMANCAATLQQAASSYLGREVALHLIERGRS